MYNKKIIQIFIIIFSFFLIFCAKEADSNTDVSPYNVNLSGSGGDHSSDEHCKDEDKRSCHIKLSEHNGVLTCFVGVQICINNYWSECFDGNEINKIPNDDGKPLSLTEEKICENNPCDVFCSRWVEDGKWKADGAVCKWPWNWSTDPAESIDKANKDGAAKEPCTHGSQCHQNQKCQDPAQGSCSHDICTKGVGLKKGCETNCVDKICDEKPQCCEKKYTGSCEVEPCLTYKKGLTKDCDPNVKKTCDWDKTCCPYTQIETCSYWGIIGYKKVCEWIETYKCGWRQYYRCGWRWKEVYICGWRWKQIYVCGWRWREFYVCGWRWRDFYVCGWRWRDFYVCGWRWRQVYRCGWRQVYRCGWRYYCSFFWCYITYTCWWEQTYTCWWEQIYVYECWWEQRYVYECWWEERYECWWELIQKCWDEPIYGFIYYDCEKNYNGKWTQKCVDQYKKYNPGACPLSWTGDWDAACIAAVHDTCHNYCDGIKLGAGECAEWEAPNFDAKCSDFELGIGLTCKTGNTPVIPVCNTGSKEAPKGVPIAIMPKGSGYFGTEPSSLPGAKYCYTDEAIPAGECRNVKSCNVINSDEVMVNPKSNANYNSAECFEGDNWGFYYDAVCGYPPKCPGGFLNTIKNEIYKSSCEDGLTPQWGFLSWDAETPKDTEISFRVKTAKSQAELSSAAWRSISVKSTGSNQDCSISGPSPCPVDLYIVLDKIDSQKQVLELEVTFKVSPDNKKSPILNAWEISYSCKEEQ